MINFLRGVELDEESLTVLPGWYSVKMGAQLRPILQAAEPNILLNNFLASRTHFPHTVRFRLL